MGGLSLAIGSGWFTLLLARGWPLAEVVLAACVAMWVQIILTELLLGWLHLLRPFWLLSVNMMLLIILWVIIVRTLRHYHLATYWHTVRSSLAVIRASITTQIILLLILIWFIWTIFLGLLFPTYAFDEHYYHMPIVASILQAQHIGLISTPIPWISAYPKNSELLVLWNTIFLHRDTVADLTMLQFWLAGGLGI